MPLDGSVRTIFNTMQHLRRLGIPGAPSTLLPGQFAINEPVSGVWPNLYGGGLAKGAGVWGSMTWGQSTWGGTSEVLTIVSPTRQVELTGNQTITGNKTISINSLKIPGGAPGFLISTDGIGNLSFVPGNGSLPSPGGTVTGDINFTGTVSLNGIPLVADAPADGKMYVRANESWVWFQTGVSAQAITPGAGVEEAPLNGLIHGRQMGTWTPVIGATGGTITGALSVTGTLTAPDPTANNQVATKQYVDSLTAATSWTFTSANFIEPAVGQVITVNVQSTAWMAVGAPLFINGGTYVVETINSLTSVTLRRLDGGGAAEQYLPLSGGTLTGNLILNGPPGTSSPSNQAATKGYVDSIVTGSLTFAGTVDATTGNATYTTSSGFTNGPIIAASAAADMYLICTVAGTIPSGPAAGLVLQARDWLISDGTAWTVIQMGQSDLGGGSSRTTALFTPPAVGSTISIQVDSTSWMDVGAPVRIADGVYIVDTVDSATQVTLERID